MHLHIKYSQGCFYILCSHAFRIKQDFFFWGRFCIKSYWNQKKSPRKIKFLNGGLFSGDFLLQGLIFHRTFLVPKFRTIFPKTFFLRTFLSVTPQFTLPPPTAVSRLRHKNDQNAFLIFQFPPPSPVVLQRRQFP